MRNLRLVPIFWIGLTLVPSIPAQAPRPTPQTTPGEVVYVTHAGKWYHRADCRYLTKKNTQLTLQEAKAQGLRPCKICRPK